MNDSTQLHTTVAEVLAAIRARLVVNPALRVSPVSDVRLGLPLPALNGTTMRMTAELLVQRCEGDVAGAAPAQGPASAPGGLPACLQTTQGAATYLQEALTALLPPQLPGANVTVGGQMGVLCCINVLTGYLNLQVPPAWLPGTCSTCDIEQQGGWWAPGPPRQPPWYLDMMDAPTTPGTLLDNTFSANALGSGVNVFLVSSVRDVTQLRLPLDLPQGVQATHEEFATMGPDGTYAPPSRVQGLYGLDGTDPLQVCCTG